MIVAAVLLLAAVAAVDALRQGGGDGEGSTSPAVAVEPAPLPVESLRRAGAAGVLVWTDSRCELHALRLPDGSRAPPPDGPDVGCEFELSPDGRRVAPRGARWGTSAYYALCRGAVVDVLFPPSGRPQYSYDGCVPAWRPTRDGPLVLTLVRDGRVLEVRPACEGQPPCEEVMLDRGDIAAALEAATDPSAVSAADVLDLEWESPERVRALLLLRLAFGASRRVVATYDSGELAFVAPLGREPFRDAAASVDGGRVVVHGVRLPLAARHVGLARAHGDSALAAAGLAGTLVYSTAAGCRLRAVRLPDLAPAPAPAGGESAGCRFELSPDGSRVAAEGAAWSPGGGLLAACSAGRTRVVDTRTERETDVDGCAPSWRSRNALVVSEGERIVQWLVDCRRGAEACRRQLLGRAALERVVRRHPNAPVAGAVRIRVLDTAWLAGDRLAVLLDATFVSAGRELGPWQSVAVFDGARLLWVDHAYRPPLAGLDARPFGHHLLVAPTLAFHASGSRLSIPDTFGEVRAGAWSPDEGWLAVAARGAVVLFRVDELRRFSETGRAPEPIKLPIDAADLAWR